MMKSNTSQSTLTQTRSLRNFLDDKRIPYILCQVDVKDGSKSPRGSTIPFGWSNWSYDECCAYNNYKADPKCSILNVNIRKGNYVVVDIDSGDINEHFKTFKNENKTKSIRRGLPHLWFERSHDDKWNDITNVNNSGIDYRYTNVFEHKDAVFENYNEYFDEFDWERHLGIKKEPKKRNNIQEKQNENIDVSNGDPLLDLIKPKYWTEYNTWRNLIWACIDKFDMEKGISIATMYSKQIPVYQEGCVEKVAEYYQDGKITWGTAHHYAKESDPDGYYRLTSTKIKNSDEMLAQLFMNIRKDEIVSNNLGNYYVYYNRKWKMLDDKRGKDFLQRIIYLDLEKEITKSKTSILKQMTEVSITEGTHSEAYLKLNKQASILQDINDRLDRASGISDIYKKVKNHLSLLENDIIFNTGKDQIFNIQFKNGVYELQTKKFRPRCKTDYVTMTLDWDYQPKREEDKIKEILDFFKKIQPNKEQRDFTISWLARCLDGSTKAEKFKMNVGKSAGNGKSTEFTIHSKCFPIYSTNFSAETFTKDYSKAHKQFYTMVENPIRFAAIEEMRQDKLDENLLKEFTTGKGFTIEVMYGTKVVVDLQAKLNTCSQHDPNSNIDEGILRRGLLQNYSSEFRDNYEDDYENHKYKRIQGWDDLFDKDDYKLAYFHLLMDYYDDFKIPEINSKAFKETLEEYDDYAHVFDERFEKSNDDKDRVTKDRVMEIMSLQKIKHSDDWRLILSKMKLAGFDYSKSKRCGNKKGCFYGIKEIEIDEEEEEDEC